MANTEESINQELVKKYRLDDTILQSFFKDSEGKFVQGATFPLRLDNRQYCSPTDYQGKNPSCCGYSAAQIMESLYWARTGNIVQFDANQIYAKAKATDKCMKTGGTYPDLAMMKALELVKDGTKDYVVKTSKSKNVDDLKRVIHQNMFACLNMRVTSDLFAIDSQNFVYKGTGTSVGGHSMVCCGYDEESKMLILQNHWGTIWGLKGFFLCPYDVWKKQNDIFCWYERTYPMAAPVKKDELKVEATPAQATKSN